MLSSKGPFFHRLHWMFPTAFDSSGMTTASLTFNFGQVLLFAPEALIRMATGPECGGLIFLVTAKDYSPGASPFACFSRALLPG